MLDYINPNESTNASITVPSNISSIEPKQYIGFSVFGGSSIFVIVVWRLNFNFGYKLEYLVYPRRTPLAIPMLKYGTGCAIV